MPQTKFENKYNEVLDERLYMSELTSGLRCFIVPKADFVEKQAMLAVRYGSADSRFEHDGKKIDTPPGIAHFLEHKLFDKENRNIFDQFVRQGASVNAFTNYTQTAYYFSCVDRFEENLRLLLEFVQTPYLTDQNVEKEKGIIGEEIKMYADMPSWRVYKNLHACFYQNSPLREDIVGTLESIERITKDLLLYCYQAFYRPNQMSLVCVGAIDPEKVCDIAEKSILPAETEPIARLYGHDKPYAHTQEMTQSMPISMPIFEFGFKETDFSTSISERMVTGKILTDIVAGESSELYENLYSDGVIDTSFAMDYLGGSFYGEGIFSGSSRQPRLIADKILTEFDRLRYLGIDERRFAAIRKKHIGRLIHSCNHIDQIAFSLVDLIGKDIDLFDLADSLQHLTLSALEKSLPRFSKGASALSIVTPPA